MIKFSYKDVLYYFSICMLIIIAAGWYFAGKYSLESISISPMIDALLNDFPKFVFFVVGFIMLVLSIRINYIHISKFKNLRFPLGREKLSLEFIRALIALLLAYVGGFFGIVDGFLSNNSVVLNISPLASIACMIYSLAMFKENTTKNDTSTSLDPDEGRTIIEPRHIESVDDVEISFDIPTQGEETEIEKE